MSETIRFLLPRLARGAVGCPKSQRRCETIDQLELYGRSVRWFHDARVPDDADPASWRPLAQRVYSTSESGPVHLNLPFREPLLGTPAELPEPIGPPLPVPLGQAVNGPLDPALDRQRGVIVAGGRHGLDLPREQGRRAWTESLRARFKRSYQAALQ